MKIKSINKKITDKLNDWLSTLPVDLAKKVRNDLLLSGGSITSMLLNEQVNDYDIYLQDMDTLIELTKYYCPDNNILDGRKKESYISNIPELSDGEENLSERAVRLKNLSPNQVKLDIDSTGKGFPVKKKNKKKYKKAFVSQNAISLTNDIQIVLRFTGTCEEIHKTFDYIHATNYFTFKDGLVTNIPALESTITKELRYNGSLFPLTSIIRMKKFILRGWSITAGEILKMMFQVSELDLSDPLVLEDQLIGVDIAYFAELIDRLKENKQPITSDFLNKMIDEVFNQIS